MVVIFDIADMADLCRTTYLLDTLTSSATQRCDSIKYNFIDPVRIH